MKSTYQSIFHHIYKNFSYSIEFSIDIPDTEMVNYMMK